jgi:Animal haem peroxidase
MTELSKGQAAAADDVAKPRPASANSLFTRSTQGAKMAKLPTEIGGIIANLTHIGKDARLVEIRKLLQHQGVLPILSEERKESVQALRPELKRFHGAKVALSYFPQSQTSSPCADKYGYMSTAAVRAATKLPFNLAMQALLGQLGAFMGTTPPSPAMESTIPAGYTYFGQFVDHDITLDVSSSLQLPETDATTINNMRSPSLDLDSLYGRGPALSAFLYAFPPPSEPPTAIRFQLGSNLPAGPGGPAGTTGMIVQTAFDVPRVINPLNAALSTKTAIIGDPRNDENLIVSQFHRAMLRFHNKVVDDLVAAGFSGDIFAEAKKLVTHHYQWAVMNDYLKRICGAPAVSAALAGVGAAIGSAFSMPVEFAVAAYRFGHSMIRHQYWINGVQINAPLANVFAFIRDPNIPVLSNWVVDFNAFFTTGISVPVNNKAMKIDSMLAAGLASLPGFNGMMAVLATRNLRRGMALGLPSGQGMAGQFGIVPMTAVQLTQGLAAAETALLNSNGGILLTKTPLWYYVLREAAVLGGGNQLGPAGARIIAETFVRMLKRDGTSYLNASPAFTPGLAAAVPGDFTVADLVNYAGVTMP